MCHTWSQTQKRSFLATRPRSRAKSGPAVKQLFFMLNSTKQHGLLTAHKNFSFKVSDVVFIRPINAKMPTIVDILTFMCRIDFMLI